MTKPRTERRKQPRVKGTASLMVGEDSQSSTIDIRDISLSGVSFIADTPIEFMTQLVMSLILPVSDAPGNPDGRVRCEGAVVRCEPTDEDSDRYEVAVFFMHLDETTKATIEKYVQAN